ncbi:MAG: hypothetical protein J7M27_01965 [Candidatus Latescibacteria bacterium]|nr:hypothetical protein [Candidatus Latescibacterota bacterium]
MKTNHHNSTSFLHDLIPLPNTRYRPIAQIITADPESRTACSRATNGLTLPEFSHRYSRAGIASGQARPLSFRLAATMVQAAFCKAFTNSLPESGEGKDLPSCR